MVESLNTEIDKKKNIKEKKNKNGKHIFKIPQIKY